MNRSVTLLAIAVILLSGAFAYHTLGQTEEETFVKVVKKVTPACVSIKVYGYKDEIPGQVGGSGVYVSPNGYILTVAHLFDNFDRTTSIVVETPDGGSVFAEMIQVDTMNDLAVIHTQFDKKTPYVRLADPRDLDVGQEVFAIGAPYGLTFSVTSGIISSLHRDLNDAYNVTQSDTSINPGNSGGPLFNLKGELVGINSFMLSASSFEPTFTGLGFSVQVGQCFEFLIRCKKIVKDLVL